MINSRPTFARPSPLVLYLVGGALLIGLHSWLELGSAAQGFTYDVVGGSAVAVALFGAWRNGPDRRLPWILMAAGQASFVAGDLLWNYFELVGRPSRRLPTSCTWAVTRSLPPGCSC